MCKRDFFKTVALVPEGLLPTNYEIDLDDIITLYREISVNRRDGIWNVISWCLCYGYVMGHRATINGVYKEVRPPKTKSPACAATQTGQATNLGQQGLNLL